MHVTLSELLRCPRCGPDWGLVLVPEVVRERRVERGVLGCPNCRGTYAVRGGVADLRVSREGPGETVVEPGDAAAGGLGDREVGEGADAREAAARLAALLGLTELGGTVLLLGPAAALASALTEVVPEGVEVVAECEGRAPRGVSGIRLGAGVPFRAGSLAGVALTGGWSGPEGVGAAAGAVRGGGRLLAEPAGGREAARAEEAGLRVLARDGETLVAGR